MNRLLMTPVLVAAALYLLTDGAPAQAVERPFHAAGVGSNSAYNSGGSMFGAGFEATHLGQSSLSVGVDYLASGLFAPFGGSLESASRDFLNFEFDEEFYLFDPATGIIATTVTFTGGTGRFADATGSADMIIVFDPNYQQFDFLIDGSIDY